MITLYQHQQTALDRTEGHNRCAYYLDMGLGKTFVGSEKANSFPNKILVVCQHSKLQDWRDHFGMNYPLTVFDLTKPKQLQEFVDGIGKAVGVINYDLIFRRKVLKSLAGFTLMLDESSVIQNETTKRAKFILGMNPQNVILLSGTPTGGKYEKLWSQCNLLGWPISKELFWKQYVETEWVEDDGFWRQVVVGYKNVDRLKEKLADHGAVFMTTDEAGIDLPTKNLIPVKMPPPPTYWAFRSHKVVTVDNTTLKKSDEPDALGCRELIGDTTLTRRLYSRQLSGMLNPARYDAFTDLVESTEDRLIVFYNFTEEMERMKALVDRPVSILNGSTKDLTAYNDRPDSITFVQYQAGAMGANFQKANKIIYFSLPESWELWEQSQKRIHRIGQDRPCFYYLLISPGTVEDDVFSTLQLRKDYNDELFRKWEKSR